jgi:GT2 family glycosyltransferase/glycosyltransferase involved in cell wall biosynthesis
VEKASNDFAVVDRTLTGVQVLLQYVLNAKVKRRADLEDAKWELAEGHESLHRLRASLLGDDHAAVTHSEPLTADIVVCVRDALDDATACFSSVLRYTDPRHRLIIVDDGSESACAKWFRSFAQSVPGVELVRHERPLGYTKAANIGLRQTSAELVILLNSDTIVTPNWLERLLACAESDPKIGIFGPLSNAASYQSVPTRVDEEGNWSLNPKPPGWTPQSVAEIVARESKKSRPRVPVVNGFCFGIKRSVIEAIGFFDEDRFPDGYGEENDFCIRAAMAGFSLVVADDAYVHHAKSKSYSHARRKELVRDGRRMNIEMYGAELLSAAESVLRDQPDLAHMRKVVAAALLEAPPEQPLPSVLFLLPVRGGGGGVHSIVQEASGMRALGANARVAVRTLLRERYLEEYTAIPNVDDLFVPFNSPEDAIVLARSADIVVATIHTSVPLSARIAKALPWVTSAYYVQDYEPWFHPEGSELRAAAEASYSLVPNMVLFAKTQWLCNTVRQQHGVEVHKVEPSIDHSVYYPPAVRPEDGPVRVTAMVRPGTPRRGPGRTMEVLRRLHWSHGSDVGIHIFGCTDADLVKHEMPRDFSFTNHGVLWREQVADLLRGSDVFLDLSDYQAFGRTALEAMACGCAVVVPAAGGADEYAVDGTNALIVDTNDATACLHAVEGLITNALERDAIARAGASTASRFTIQNAAHSELDLFRRIQEARF